MIPPKVFDTPLVTGPIYRNIQNSRSTTSQRLDELAYIIFGLYSLAICGKDCLQAYKTGERFLPGITIVSAVAIVGLSVAAMLYNRSY